MKNITVSVDEETYRLSRVRAAERGTSVSALVRAYLVALVQGRVIETEFDRLRRLQDETLAAIRARGEAGRSVIVSSHVLHEVERMTSNILLLHAGRILAEGDVHQIRDLIDEHPHTVRITADDPRRLARHLLGYSHVIAMQLQDGAVIAQTSRPDAFYTELTVLAAGEEAGAVGEVTSPDDNLQAVFSYLVEH